MAKKTPKARNRGNVNIQIGQADNAQIVAGYERVDATFGPRLDVKLGSRARERKAPAGRTSKPAPTTEQTAAFAALRSHFTLEELETICWELGITFDDLPARTLTGKARQLVERATALHALDKLMKIVRRERPNIDRGQTPDQD
ncbi:MAG: hypothetical protein ACUVRU_05430 [Anaerolineae bacterium]